MNILAIPGSIRKQSFNKSLAYAAQKLVPAEMNITVFEVNDIPLMNQDLEANLPQPILDYYKAIESADGIIFVTPEYNRSYSGVMKNAIDWASRKPILKGKPVCIMGASDGYFGTARAQANLKTLVTELGMRPMVKPEVLVPEAQNSFDENGNLHDENIRQRIIDQLEAFKEWVTLVNR